MAFPISPTNGQQVTLNNGITYQYDTANTTWVRVAFSVSTVSGYIFDRANAAYGAANTASTSDYTNIAISSSTYGGTSSIPVITVQANGRISSIANTSISIPSGTNIFANSGQLTANSSTGNVLLGLATSGVTPGSYTSSSITVDAYGRVTSASSGAGGGGGVSITNDTTTAANTYYPLMAYNATSGSLSTANTASSKLYFNPSTGTLNSTIFNSLSDENTKTELVQIQGALDKLKQLTGYTYTFIEGGERSAGLISQQVSKVLPEAVKENNGLQSLNYNATIGLIVESIKELNDKVDSIIQKLG